jgi:L-fuconate dehydratase
VPETITKLEVVDVRFPTSDELVGSDATNKDPDYSATYVVLETNRGQRGYGLIFTIGRGNEICCRAVEAMRHLVVGRELASITGRMGDFYRSLHSDSQLRWLGPETGVIHMAAGAIANAAWDLWARHVGKPVWKLLSDMSPAELIACLDFTYVTDALTPDEALDMLRATEAGKQARVDRLLAHGYPCYTTSAGWLGFSDEKLARLCEEAVVSGFKAVKLKVGGSIDDDRRRCAIAREALGPHVRLLIDANQRWEVAEAIDWVRELAQFDPYFIEEPTSPDDVLGHRRIREAVAPVRVATGEHCQNRVLFKQFIAGNAVDVVQIDACRLAGLNEILVVALIAAKYGKPLWPHAGGVGLCEYVQHVSMIDYVCISATLEDRMVEFVDHLHEHFEAPCRVVNGAYQAPLDAGFSIRIRPDSIARYTFPSGDAWRGRVGR